jgi:hypothetical protein
VERNLQRGLPPVCDFYYAENMNGYDWMALRDQYQPLLDHVASRSDLNYVLGEMVGELSTSHSYIYGGDFDLPKRVPVAICIKRGISRFWRTQEELPVHQKERGPELRQEHLGEASQTDGMARLTPVIRHR